MQQVITTKNVDLGTAGRTFLHLIHADTEVQDLAASSKMNAEWDYLQLLFDRGRRWADSWLVENFDKIGQVSSFDLDDLFSEHDRPFRLAQV